MEDWSPRTLVRYGFCCEDEEGNIVSVWNFAELDEALRGIDSGSDDEEVIGTGTLTVDVIDDASVNESTGLPAAVQNQVNSAPAGFIEYCDDGHVREHQTSSIEDGDDGYSLLCIANCPMCEWVYRKAVEDFYADMPTLQPCEETIAFYADMPKLESSVADDERGVRTQLLPAFDFQSSVWRRFTSIRDWCARVVLLQLICTVFDVPTPVFTDSLDIVLCMGLLYCD